MPCQLIGRQVTPIFSKPNPLSTAPDSARGQLMDDIAAGRGRPNIGSKHPRTRESQFRIHTVPLKLRIQSLDSLEVTLQFDEKYLDGVTMWRSLDTLFQWGVVSKIPM